jgi:hypothetical protein
MILNPDPKFKQWMKLSEPVTISNTAPLPTLTPFADLNLVSYLFNKSKTKSVRNFLVLHDQHIQKCVIHRLIIFPNNVPFLFELATVE